MISEVTSLFCWPQGNVYKEAAKKCSLLWYPRLFHTWKQRKAGMEPETITCLDNHSRELSEVCKLSLWPNSKSQSATDYQVPKGWLCPNNLRLALPCPSHTLGWPGPAPAFTASECAGSQRETFHSWQRSWGRRLGIRKGGIEPQECPRIFSSIYPQKTRVCLLYCFVLPPLTLLGAVPHHHLALSKS